MGGGCFGVKSFKEDLTGDETGMIMMRVWIRST
jgi:hypothetical protein